MAVETKLFSCSALGLCVSHRFSPPEHECTNQYAYENENETEPEVELLDEIEPDAEFSVSHTLWSRQFHHPIGNKRTYLTCPRQVNFFVLPYPRHTHDAR